MGQRQAAVEVRDHAAREAQHAGEHDVDPVAAEHLLGVTRSGSPASSRATADAVAADVHQRAAVQVAAHPDVSAVASKLNDARISRSRPIAPLPTSSASRGSAGGGGT